MNTLEAMQKSKENPGEFYENEILSIHYTEARGGWLTNVNKTGEGVFIPNYDMFNRKGQKVEEGQWYKEDWGGHHYKILDVYVEDTLTIRYLVDGEETKEVPYNFTQDDIEITDEEEIMFLEHGRVPKELLTDDVIEVGNLADGIRRAKYVTRNKKLQQGEELICFREHRADWKGASE